MRRHAVHDQEAARVREAPWHLGRRGGTSVLREIARLNAETGQWHFAIFRSARPSAHFAVTQTSAMDQAWIQDLSYDFASDNDSGRFGLPERSLADFAERLQSEGLVAATSLREECTSPTR